MYDLEEITKEQRAEVFEAIKEGRLYDFICSNSWRIEDDVLQDLLLECIAVIDIERDGEKLADNLKEFKEWEA